MILKATFFVLIALTFYVQTTPLDDYVNAPDPTYRFEVYRVLKKIGYTLYNINFTSQTWLTPADSTLSVWSHWLTLCIPDKVASFDTAFLYIDGGSSGDPPPDDINILQFVFCTSSNTVSAYLNQIPDQPIRFLQDPKKENRIEDRIIAYTWKHFFENTSAPNWLLRLPMTKAVVRALDTIQNVTSTIPNVPKIEKFVVAGASKRGWTTWTTGAVEWDKRILAIIPMVIPILNMVKNINHMWQLLGEWSFALDDYLDEGDMAYLNNPEFQLMADIIDPIAYNDRYVKFPKYVICATGDEFFPPDGPNLFWDELKGEKYLRMIPNTEHALVPDYYDVGTNMETFYWMVLTNQPRPRFSWTMEATNSSGSITLTAIDKPTHVYMYHATTLSSTRRDFRFLTCSDLSKCFQPIFWFYEEIFDQGNGVYVAKMNAPSSGWTGFLIEVVYTYNNTWNIFAPESSFKATTTVNVVPNYLPFPPCGDHCQTTKKKQSPY
eukprot:TRINITY_DN6009_c0_g1_i1.p1 TRINITY_DN6009_c0_g1~~TRINITY_DN6009_c0_g1_i1.p1  ORF type:complete len:492 (-),score=82.90 TRINITY_DN6009_c0_g1_i1:4-1479(-)